VCHLEDHIWLNIDDTPAAFIISDLTFYGENKYCLLLATALANPDLVYHVDVCWQFQKNDEINQKKSFPHAGQGNIIHCSVCAWLRVAARWFTLKLDTNHPLTRSSLTWVSPREPCFLSTRSILITPFVMPLTQSTIYLITTN
jgi:hypothetical protein